MPALRFCMLLAASLIALRTVPAAGQGKERQPDLRDSINVASLTYAGAKNVATDDLKRVVFTRSSSCRLVVFAPVCKLTPTLLFTDRRRTTRKALGEDIEKLLVYYWQRGFRSAQIDTVLVPAKRGMAVTFRIVEGEATRIGRLTVTQRATVLSPAELAMAVTVHDGDPLSLVALDSTLSRLRTAIWNKGYGDVRIDTVVPRPDASNLVPVTIDIDPRWITRVARVEFQGNAYLDDATLRRGLLLKPGALYTRNALLETQKRLFQSPALARALVITPPAGDSLKTITVAITEMARRTAALTLGFNTIEFGQASVELRNNDLGAGRWFRLNAAAGNLLGEQLKGRGAFQDLAAGADAAYLRPTYQASATLTQPWIAGARTSAAITAFAGRRSIANVVMDENVGVTVGLVRELSPRLPIGINYRLESSRVQGSAVYFCAGYGVCDTSTREALTRRQRLAPIGVSSWIDRADDLEVPTRGYTAVMDAEHASSATGSTFAHSRIAVDGSYYRSVSTPKVVAGVRQLPKVLALHARGGYVRPYASDRAALGVGGNGSGLLHPRARFYAGGMQSVRGFSENELGPRVLQARRASLAAVGCSEAAMTSGECDPARVPSNELFPRPVGGSSVLEASAELRVPLFKALGGVAFLDGAYVGTGGLDVPGRGRGAITPGVGARYRSPLGVLRLDFGLRPVGAQSLPVVVAVPDANAGDRVVLLAREKLYSPIDPSPGALRSLGRRIVVHFAMGQAF